MDDRKPKQDNNNSPKKFEDYTYTYSGPDVLAARSAISTGSFSEPSLTGCIPGRFHPGSFGTTCSTTRPGSSAGTTCSGGAISLTVRGKAVSPICWRPSAPDSRDCGQCCIRASSRIFPSHCSPGRWRASGTERR